MIFEEDEEDEMKAELKNTPGPIKLQAKKSNFKLASKK